MITNSGIKYVGVDLSDGMLAITRRDNTDQELLKMDVTKLEFEDRSFDIVWASAVLLHLPARDLGRAMKEIVRVMKDDGFLYIALEKQKAGRVKTEMKKSVKEGKEVERFFMRYTDGEFERVLERSGFEVLKDGIHREEGAGGKTWLYYIARLGIKKVLQKKKYTNNGKYGELRFPWRCF